MPTWLIMSEDVPEQFSQWRPEAALGAGYPLPAAGSFRVVAIGNFDGAHRGHQAVATEARALAGTDGAGRQPEILALSFDPHPRAFFQRDRQHFRLLDPAMRAAALHRIGFDGVVILPFTAEFAAMEPGEFIEKILLERLGVKGVVVGEDFHFGRARAGTPAFLAEEGRRLGFAVRLVPPFRDAAGQPGGETVISSSAIRAALASGDIPRANAMLGYAYAVEGAVIHGEKRGRDLGYPTANMALDPANGLAHGIYAVRVKMDGHWHQGVASFGRRPHFDNGAPLLETHVFDFKGDLYGKTITVAFEAYLRGEAKFESLDALILQMNADSAEARRLLGMQTGPATRSS